MTPRTLDVSRRQFLSVAGAGVVVLGLTACGVPSKSGKGATTIEFMAWGGDAEVEAYKMLVERFESENRTIKVDLKIVPYAQYAQTISSRLQAGNAPDAFRIIVQDLGLYSSNGALLDLSPYVDSDFKGQFQSAYWAATEYDGKPYGIPQQTDTTALLFDKALLEAAGVTSVPTSASGAWSWDEFIEVAAKVKSLQPANKYSFMYNWAQTGAFRWMNWLFTAGGNLLTPDLKSTAIESAEGTRALEFAQSFFTKGLVPPNTSTGGKGAPDEMFLARTVGMAFTGAFLLPNDISNAKFDWGVTFHPQDVLGTSDTGASPIVGAAQTKNPEAVADFLKFLGSRWAMTQFCRLTNQSPVRNDLDAADIEWAYVPDKMGVFVEQAKTLTPFQIQQVTVPAFNNINTILKNELDGAFVGGKSASTTLSSIAQQVTSAIKKA